VQIGTACLTIPDIYLTILEGIERFLQEKGINNIADIVGVAQDRS